MDGTAIQPTTDPFTAYGGKAMPPPTPPSTADPFSAYGGKATSVNPAQPSGPGPAAATTQPTGLTDNPRGEGLYTMKNPDGQPVSIPYSSVGKALDQGHLFADKDTLQQYARDHAADPLSEDRVDKFIDAHPYIGRPIAGLKGAGTGVLKTVTAGDRLPTTRGETELQLAAATPTRAAEAGGEAAEGVGEYFTGDELLALGGRGLQALGLTDKLKSLSQIAQTVNKAPEIVQKLIKIGMSAVKQGTIAAGQTATKTQLDPMASLSAGAGTAALSAATEGLGEGLSSAISNRASTVEKVGGVDSNIPAEIRNAKETPAQTAGKQAISNAAKGTAKQNLDELHEGSTPPATAPGLASGTGPFEFNLKVPSRETTTGGSIATRAAEVPKTESTAGANTGKAQTAELGSTASAIPNRVQERGTPGFKTSSAEGEAGRETDYVHSGNMTTQDPNIARAHIQNLNDAIEGGDFSSWPKQQQKDMLEARADAQKQMAQYHERVFQNLPPEQRGVEPIDVAKTVGKVGSYTDAADQVEKGGTRIYQLLNDVTGDKFNALREQNKNAWDAYAGASGPEAQAGAERGLEESNRQLDQMFTNLRGVVDRRTLDAADDAFRNAQTIRRVATAVDGSFSGNASASARSWEQRGFDGNRLMASLSKLQTSMGRTRLDRVIGRENVDTLFQVAELNRTNAQRARFGAAIKPVVDTLMHMHVGPIAAGGYLGHLVGIPWEAGAAAGWGASAASKMVMNKILTNPQIAKNVVFAIDSGAKPENYGPFIANLISQSVSQGGQK